MDTSFEQYRPLLFSIAYRMLGSAAEAEDIVQDTFVRYQAVDEDGIQSPKAFLAKVITRLCINHLNSARHQRETYLGPWLPEPIAISAQSPFANPAERATEMDSISLAFLVILEKLSPPERAVFLLHEVFDYDYKDIAEILDKRETACRQLYSRAKKHIAENRPRFKSTHEDHQRFLNQFVHAVQEGDLHGLMALLTEDVTLVPDGGGQRGAAIRILYGREAVAQFVIWARGLTPEGGQFGIEEVNGQAAIVIRTQTGTAFNVVAVEIENNAIRKVLTIGAADKLKKL